MKVFYGEDRGAAEKVIRNVLGENYEVFEGEELTMADLPSIFQGMSLFDTEKRRILLKNLAERSEIWEKVADYADTDHEVIIWELKIDKRSAGYKKLQAAGVEMREFTKVVPRNRAVFGLLDLALRDGEKAVREVEKMENTEDPYMVFGLLVSQLLKRKIGKRERRALKMMAEVDIQMKSSKVGAWELVKGWLVRL